MIEHGNDVWNEFWKQSRIENNKTIDAIAKHEKELEQLRDEIEQLKDNILDLIWNNNLKN